MDEPTEISTLDALALQAFFRTLRLAEGVAVLLLEHLTEEALILGRSMFEDSLRLADLAEDANMRPALLLGWARDGLQQLRGLAHDASFSGLAASPNEFFVAAETQRAKLDRYAARHGIGRPRRFRSSKDAAAAHGRLESFWTFSLAHEMVHGSDPSFVFSRLKKGSDILMYQLRTDDRELEVGVACFRAESCLHAGISAARIFGKAGVEAMRERLAELAELQSAVAAQRTTDRSR